MQRIFKKVSLLNNTGGRLSSRELMNSFAFDLKQMFKPGDQKSWVQVLVVIQELSISCWTAHGQCQHL